MSDRGSDGQLRDASHRLQPLLKSGKIYRPGNKPSTQPISCVDGHDDWKATLVPNSRPTPALQIHPKTESEP